MSEFHPNYCLPLILPGLEQVRFALQANIERYAKFEIWLDYIEELDLPMLQSFTEQYQGKLIFVLRRLRFEEPHLGADRRREIIAALADTDVLLDFDVFQQADDLAFSVKQNPQAHRIVSYHNYEFTPGDQELSHIVAAIEGCHPEILKISTMCRSHSDALRLMRLGNHIREQKRAFIVLGMGEFGRCTRIWGAMAGNALTFAPLEAQSASAPGQLTLKQFQALFSAEAV